MGHPGGILGRAENGNSVMGGTEGFDSFIRLLTIVETWCHTMNPEEGVGDEGRRTPFCGFDGIMRLDVTVD